MPTCCPACDRSLEMPDANFCGTCGEPINRDPDREFIRGNATGFLSDQIRRQLIDTIDGKRDHRSEYTRIQVQEHARRALFDFGLIYRWDGIEDGDVCLAGLGSDASDEEEDGDDHEELMAQIIALTQILEIVYTNLGASLFGALLTDVLRMSGDADPDDDVEVELVVNGDPINDPLERYIEDLKRVESS